MEIDNLEIFPILDSVKEVVSQSRHVLYHHERIEAAVAGWGHLLEAGPSWDCDVHYFDGAEETVRWLFTLDVLNHSFWPDENEPVWEVAYRGDSYSGYYGLAVALKRAMEKGFPITSARYLSELPAKALESIFEGAGNIPMFDERLRNLRETGKNLLSRWDGDAVRLVDAAAGSAVRLVGLIAGSFPSFRDQALYGGKAVYFLKRAQIFAADLHSAFGGRLWGQFMDMDKLTAFADYKLPQVLRELGVLSYRPSLERRIDNRRLLESGGPEEVEIRAMTIRAVEALRNAFGRAGRTVTSPQVDNWLWRLGQNDSFRKRPYHRCRTIFY